MKKILFTLLIITSGAEPAAADIPRMWYADWDVAGVQGGEWASVFVLPDGDGKPFTEAFLVHGGGEVIDATVTITFSEMSIGPLAHMPAEDVWLQGASDGLTFCGARGLVADAPTDAQGTTRFTSPVRAGGYDADGLVPRVVYDRWGPVDLFLTIIPIRMNSADINGDGRVDLSDTGYFAADMFVGPYDYRSDFNADGTVNLTDAGFIGTQLGVSCP